MKQHLIVLDLDGTLLTDQHTISPKTKQTLMKAKEAGHQIMIATGRPFRASNIYYQELGLTTPIVNFNGAYIHHPRNPSWQAIHSPIDMKVVHDVIDSVDKYQYENLIAEVIDDVYIHVEDKSMMDIFRMGNPKVTIGNLRGNLSENPTSLLIHADEQNVPLVRKHLQEVHAELIEHRRWGAPFNIVEVVRKGLNKAVGVSLVAKYLGIPRERIIAFGDEDNDLEMIDYAGIGVAMGNGISKLKSIADEVTGTNNEDGIADFLMDRLKLA
ncbi:Cof-type HAD-IIB family hydrolase [Ureibacillus sp. FSL K6-8385]|uniref:HAD family phosphatase n=1 Tax=Ureibacillus terrenus TaxID=118246 RepID=A0A540V3P5_9BACL|nr:Cof-type HAD-IIB family hydrolase [Ureibacillus terrenus]MED3661811.1 Cof-type HAD-IIB family hydrolase [Ureibacillus terrenus]MED3763114.1 Cof-type HAD-IIB family hydrolase [Ureibacillus terrenus]TQE91376.1 HAD family phosphatase [Ureibacillus terrenus]